MNKKISSALLVITLALFTIDIHSMEIKNSMKIQNSQNHIVFDMGFLMQPNHTRFIQNLGMSGIFHYLLSGNFNEQKALQELFEVIKDIDLGIEEKDTETVFWQNEQVPQPMVSWLKNKVTCEQILEQAQNEIAKKYYITSHMNSVVAMIFEPKACSQILSPNQSIFNLINRLQKEGHNVHILSNLHKDIRTNLVETYHDLFSQIKGNILVSGDIGQVKCKEHSKLYQHLLGKLPDFHNIFFIETSETHKNQIESLITYQKLKAIVANPKEISTLIQQLHEEKLLPIATKDNFSQNI